MSGFNVKLYTDGSSLGNPGPSGWCALLEYINAEGKVCRKQVSGSESNSTNNRMELKAVIEGIKLLSRPCNVEIISDSTYVCDGIEKYMQKWIERKFRGVKNPDLWAEYLHCSGIHVVTTRWIKAHNGYEQNEHCDKVARANAASVTKRDNKKR